MMRTTLAALAVTLLAVTARAADDVKGPAVNATQKGSILRREKPDAKWQYVEEKEAIKAGDLLVGLPGAKLDDRSKSVQLQFLTDFGDSPFPVIECAVVLHESKTHDLDFTLDRGRADLTNTKEKGAAKVRVHVHDQVFDLTLKEPKTRVALELYGRWAPGGRFKADPEGKGAPAAHLVVLVLSGALELKHGSHIHHMAAPPEAALIQWDNKGGLDRSPHKLPQLPAWVKPDLDKNPKVQLLKKLYARYYELVKTKDVDEVLKELIQSEDKDFHLAFVVFCGALDRLELAAPIMRDPKYGYLWDDAIRILRHWIGRGPGQDQKLQQMLIASKNFKPVDSETVLHLLHGFCENDLSCAETYETLIDYLEDDRVLIRALANWHLVRLVPEGKDFKYDPAAADKAAREEAIKKWRMHIPPGKLPPPPKKDK